MFDNMIKEETQPISDDEVEKIMMAIIAFHDEPITESELEEQAYHLTNWANRARCDVALCNLVLKGKLAIAYKNGKTLFKLMTPTMAKRNTVYSDKEEEVSDPADWWKNT